MTPTDFLNHCLTLDLESTPDGKIFRIGATFRDEIFERKGRFVLKDALLELDRFGNDAKFVLGHNLLGHDLRLLATQFPDLALLNKPVIDTLYLSPLAFPENPYHRLVKDYKLLRESVNDPVADARLSAAIFTDQWESFSAMGAAVPDLLSFYRYCFESSGNSALRGAGLAEVFATLGAEKFEIEEALEVLVKLIADKVCRTALRTVARQYLWDPHECVALSYCVAKGTEFDHVLIFDDWAGLRNDDLEEMRRAYYVGMTRARKTLVLLEDQQGPNPFSPFLGRKFEGYHLLSRKPDQCDLLPAHILGKRYEILGLKDFFLDYAGRLPDQNPVHYHLQRLRVGDALSLRPVGSKIEVTNAAGFSLAMLSRQAEERWRSVVSEVENLQVVAIVERRAEDVQDEEYQKLLHVKRWEVPVVEVVYRQP